MKQWKTSGLALGAACVLLCLVLISSHFASGLYAKYIINASGSDGGRAAVFRIGAAMTGEAGAYGLTFTNDSETAVSYSVTVRPREPGMFSAIHLDGITDSTPDATGAVTFSRVGSLAPGSSGTAALTLVVDPAFAAPDAVSDLLDFSNDSSASAEAQLPFSVIVTFEQIN